MSLCSQCQVFDIQNFRNLKFPFKSYRLDLLKEGRQAGCRFCTLILLTGERTGQMGSHSEVADKQVLVTLQLRKRDGPAFRPQDYASGLQARGLAVYFHRDGSNLNASFQNAFNQHHNEELQDLVLAADLGTSAYTSGDVASNCYRGEAPQLQQYAAIISAFLTECQMHRICQSEFKNMPLPTRCIEISKEGYRLTDTAGQEGVYASLSHRWKAETEKCRTLMCNYQARKEGRDFESLSNTFVEFLELVGALGMRYAWIDSVCIIQEGDDGADWRKESVKMAAYYQNARITIAAASSSAAGSADTLFPKQFSRPSPQFAQLPYRTRDGRHEGFYYACSSSLSMTESFEKSVQKSNLMKRGWVYQEYILSHRIAIISDTAVFFECYSKPVTDDLGIISMKKKRFNLDDWVCQSDSWYDVIEQFSILELTRLSDRLMALSGFASVYGQAILDTNGLSVGSNRHASCKSCPAAEYVAGVWLRDLSQGLLWASVGPRPRVRIPEFPSWSWASIAGPIKWRRRNSRHVPVLDGSTFREGLMGDPPAQFELVGLKTRTGARLDVVDGRGIPHMHLPVDVNPFQVDGDNAWASLMMKGRLQPVLLRARFDAEQEGSVALLSGMGHSTKDMEEWGHVNRRKVCSSREPNTVTGWGSFEHPDFYGDANWEQEIFAFHIMKTIETGGILRWMAGYRNHFHVIFLRRVNYLEFERVGVGILWGSAMRQGYLETEEREFTIV